MCWMCRAATGFVADTPPPQASGGNPVGGGPPGDALGALLATGSSIAARWNFPAAIGTPMASPGGMGEAASVSFGFPSALPADYVGVFAVSNFQPLTLAQQAATRAALQLWADVARLTFTETTGALAEIRLGRVDQTSGFNAYAYYPSYSYSFNGAGVITAVTPQPIGGDVLLGYAANLSEPVPGSSGFALLIHELGHAIGLKHPFEGPVTLPAATNTTRYTQMSYTDAANMGVVTVSGGPSSYSWTSSSLEPSTPMLYDVLAAQALYGANMATRAGDTTYAWAPNERLFLTIWDGGGNDTIDASNQTLSSVINLAEGSFSSIARRLTEAERRMEIPAWATAVPTPSYDGVNNLAIAYGAQIENAFGGAGDDILSGNTLGNLLRGHGGTDSLFGYAGHDTLDGGPGNDFLFGGAGNDTYFVDSGLDAVDEGSLQPSLGFGGTDTIISTANFFWDVYSVAETIRLAPNADDPTGAGSTLVGGVFDNTLVGNAGRNVLFGRGGSDIYDAGDGIDFMSLSTLGVTDVGNYVANGVNTVLVRPRQSGDVSWDIVFEFEPGRDKLDVSLYGYANAAAVIAKFTDTGASTYAALGDGLDILWLVNTSKAALSAGDFIV